ncbi:hypothetical protein BDZ89DRAFT_1116799 [Hymenopellis radicata]|nr:hypothetical protein BDZ89DRAFT_1116799 [Hymenopellis radicata]
MSALEDEFGLSAQVAERLIGDLLNTEIMEVVLYGLYTMIFGATVRQIVARGEWPTQRILLTIVICVIWVFATVYAGMVWAECYVTFVSHGQSRESVLRYFLWSSNRLTLVAVRRTFITLNATIADLINIWRCWVLYDRSWGIAVLPLLGVVCGLISHILRTIAMFPSGPASSVSTLASTNWLVVYYSATASTNILTTSLIIYRILSVTGFKGVRTYRGIIEILVESAFLYSTTYIIYLAVCVHDFYVPYPVFTDWYVGAFLNAVTAAAPTLIIGRVMAGKARLNDSWLHTLPEIHTTNIAGGMCFASNHAARTGTPAATVDLFAHAQESTPKRSPEQEDSVQPEDCVLAVARTSGVDVEKGSGNNLV